MQPNHSSDDHLAYIGMRSIWGGAEPFGLSHTDRRQHLYCIGQTGTGKSTLLRNLLLQDIYAGRGVGLIDPHGDLAEDLLDHIPSWRTDDLVYFNPMDLEYPIGFNLLQNVPKDDRPRVASGLVRTMKAIWRDSWGSRLEYILYAAIAALLDCQNVSILGIQRMLVDHRYRHWVVRQVEDPVVRTFWLKEFENYDDRFRQEAIAPIQNKIGQLLMSPPLRNILGQVKRKIDARFMMDNRRIFIANLSKGLLGEDKANLLGSLLVTSFELAALERANIPEEKRRDFFLFVDEFQNVTTDSFASILSEARKYRLCLTLSHQFLHQVDERIQQAIFGNVGTLVSFRVGEDDATVLSRQFGGSLLPPSFSSLANFEVLTRQLFRGRPVEPFLGRTMSRLDTQGSQREANVRRSRAKYATSRGIVEEKTRRWFST